ncbi:phosphatidylserine/phosphatidylglycerophosphate/cardiolipin synthase-like enzyme [Ralstonia sp. GP73]|jgi:phosphatidylserine/phosphatidylglycerophosphate/cardiolipin synthase-like enzyme|uniref:Cardiolipin synthase B n=1 Tax=Ralstonia thomasii TaxID=3058596 RepID=A0ABM9JZA1_9RALS|nr:MULTISPECIES: phospholipase D-like domain-containing protein [unclassified Ralstonia]MDH6645319.1 phosphatidylserine/phosphatidylglycerophosphate/cardiolipin synthase-like enzyme [Ralstonia sp. GP73]CAJ0807715.1 Cardiolipin synthase B [Ralstonia sp. LMG 18095]
MSAQKLTAFEQATLAGLADKAGLAAALLEAWADLPANSVQSARSLVDAAQLGVTEEAATQDLLERSVGLGLVEAASVGFRARSDAHLRFPRLAFALNAVEHYRSVVHRDATLAQIVLTKPPRPSALEQRLSALGWRTTDLESTEHAFHGMVRTARRRVIVMTPFFDRTGAAWLQELLSHVSPGVERTLILRSLEDTNRKDYPVGFDAIAPWLKASCVQVFNYSIARMDGGRETFHAKAVLCDRSAAYLGSSNVTAASLENSMEMGVVLEGRAAAGVAEVVDAVLAAATKWL